MRWVCVFLVIAVLGVAGCAGVSTSGGTGDGGPDPEPAEQDRFVAPLNATGIRNASYSSAAPGGGFVQLRNGVSIQPGPGGNVEVSLQGDPAYGDLDGDKLNDAAVILVTKTAVGNVYYELFAVRNRDGSADPAAGVFLGDRIRVNAVGIAAGKIYLTLVRMGPTDVIGSPTLRVKESYELQGGGLVRVSEARLGL